MTEPAWLTVTEAIERLAHRGLTIDDETLRRWARSGQIESAKLPSGQFRFSPAAIDAIIEPVVTT